MCRLSRNLGASTSWNTKGLSRPVMGLLYLFLYCRITSTKSPASGAGNVSKPRLLSQVWGVRENQCFSEIGAVEVPSRDRRTVRVVTRSEGCHVKWRSFAGITPLQLLTCNLHLSFCRLAPSSNTCIGGRTCCNNCVSEIDTDVPFSSIAVVICLCRQIFQRFVTVLYVQFSALIHIKIIKTHRWVHTYLHLNVKPFKVNCTRSLYLSS
jgi:hypothetical protein